jgi:hypothetical protein
MKTTQFDATITMSQKDAEQFTTQTIQWRIEKVLRRNSDMQDSLIVDVSYGARTGQNEQEITLESVIDGFLNEHGVLDQITSDEPQKVALYLKKVIQENEKLKRDLDAIRKIAFDAVK